MTLPKEAELEMPLLIELYKHKEGMTPSEAYASLKEYFHLSDDDLQELNPSGTDNKWNQHVRWAKESLKSKGEVDADTRGIWKITPKGLERLKKEKPEFIKEVGKNKILLFKYNEDEWNSLEKIKEDFEKEGYIGHGRTLHSYNAEPENNDTIICMPKQTMEMAFICKVRKPSIEEECVFDYIHPIFLNNVINFTTEISQEPPYRVLKPKDKPENQYNVLYNLSEFKLYLEKIKTAIIKNNKEQETDILRYFSETENFIEEKSLLLPKSSKQVILYGPPGTGKTYNTKRRAVDIIEGKNGNS